MLLWLAKKKAKLLYIMSSLIEKVDITALQGDCLKVNMGWQRSVFCCCYYVEDSPLRREPPYSETEKCFWDSSELERLIMRDPNHLSETEQG